MLERLKEGTDESKQAWLSSKEMVKISYSYEISYLSQLR